jgi:UDP-N-acetylmuramyl pentapeptide phosphotransferase/UDP-N-acetylglucosamine-1-phosphate transferase
MINSEHALAVPIAALFLSWALVAFLVRRETLIVDIPNERSLHARPVPRTGGIAIATGALCACAALPGAGVLVFAAAAVALVSLVDDLRGLSVATRLAAQVALAGAFVTLEITGGSLVEKTLLMLSVVWLANLYNFMDGSDGLAGGMAVIGFGVLAAAAWMAGDLLACGLSAAVAAAAAPFLFYNFQPARIFMGDAGSVTLGFLAGGIGIMGWRSGTWPLIFPLVVFSPFIADATLTLLKRVLRREAFWRAHREHYYQKLVRMGLGHRNTALLEYSLMLVAAGVALGMLHFNRSNQLWIGAAWLALLLALAALIDRSWAAFRARSEPA